MKNKDRGFDRVAWVYEPLAKAVFGKSLERAQEAFFSDLPERGKVLILGGGTGWVLERLFADKPKLEVWYVEASEKMLQMSQRRVASSKIHWIHGTEEDLPEEKFDVIITHFLLDLFEKPRITDVIQRLKNVLSPSGVWLVADFDRQGANNVFKKALLWMMYRFFRALCGIEAKTLPAVWEHLKKEGLRTERSEGFYFGMVRSSKLAQKDV